MCCPCILEVILLIAEVGGSPDTELVHIHRRRKIQGRAFLSFFVEIFVFREMYVLTVMLSYKLAEVQLGIATN